jgi:dipeptidyl aminopeptidase/acylaminoacyl peptidase
LSRAGRLAALALVAVPCALAATVAVRTWNAALLDFRPPRGPVKRPASGGPLDPMIDVTFSTPIGDELRGWYLPSRNHAAVAVLHGGEADRTTMLDRAAALAAAGFGVLAFDLPGCGESSGKVTWGPSERAAVAGALTFLSGRPDVDPGRLGLLGFSQGAYHAVQAAAGDPRARALVLEGCPRDYVDETFDEFPKYGPLSRWAALLARRSAGPWYGEPTPFDLIARIAPRPVLFIAGTIDHDVPPENSRRLFERAGEPKELWLMPGADHGNYSQVDPQTYAARLQKFFTRTLLQ